MKKQLLAASLLALMGTAPLAHAADYAIDTKGAHASVNFKVKHIGFSWLTGRFNKFDGQFSYDAENPTASTIEVNIDTTSIDSNHAERDKHIRSGDFLNVSKFPTAKFVSTKVVKDDDNELNIHGNLTLHGVTKPVVIEVEKVGEGKDPWGGYRVGFEGSTTISMREFGIEHKLGDLADTVELELHVEGIRK
ncbi:YceI family protein [Bowmanella sp. Y26]|uniref:YceI family protein n=1 Tax=Bowmanella yangjiangensis TaxID=2811230 RepID=UPI001BDD0383|nr:YceI family protein [Bowmanella yangjiangensis]MBT1065633.1 YceI family protein [Bowmanella yangjiangensis]